MEAFILRAFKEPWCSSVTNAFFFRSIASNKSAQWRIFSNGCQLFNCLELSFPSTSELSVWSFDVKPVHWLKSVRFHTSRPILMRSISKKFSPWRDSTKHYRPAWSWKVDDGAWGLCSSQASRRKLGDGSMGTWRTNVRVSNLSSPLAPRIAGRKKKRQISKSSSASRTTPLCQLRASKTQGLLRPTWIPSRMMRDHQQQGQLCAQAPRWS